MILGTFVWIVGLVWLWLRVWLDSHSFDSMTVFIHHGSISIRVNVRVCIVIEIGIVCVVTVVVKGSFETAAIAVAVTVTIAAVATAWKGVVGVSVPKVILCGCEWVGIVGVGL